MTIDRFSTLRIALTLCTLGAVTAAYACSTTGVAVTNSAAQAVHRSPLTRVGPAAGNTWVLGAAAPTHQFTAAAAAIGSTIYLLGGEDHTKVLNENDVYDTTTNSWSRARRMPTPRAALSAAAVNGVVFAIGGETFTGTPLTTVEAYDPVSNTWSAKAPLPVAVDSMMATVDNGLIYVVGGLDSSNGTPFNGVQVYDPSSDSWSSAAPLGVAKAYAFTATVGAKIVSADGFVGNGPTVDNEIYDPATDTWTTELGAPSARYGGCVGSIGGLFYIADGLRFAPLRSASPRLEAYDISTNSWMKLASNPNPMIGPASAVVNGRLFCIGGSPFYGQPFYSAKVEIYTP